MSNTPLTDEATKTTDWFSGEPVVVVAFARELERDVRETLLVLEKVLTDYPPRPIDMANASSLFHIMRKKHLPSNIGIVT